MKERAKKIAEMRRKMKKVIIIGCPGSGKSTLARELHSITGIPLYHLDMLYWNKDKTFVSDAVFIERQQNVMKTDTWMIDGNYKTTIEMRMKECDTVIFLDYPVELCLEGERSRRGKQRPDMPWKDEEEDEGLISFIKNYEKESKPQVLELFKKYSNKNILVFQSREETEKFIEQMKIRIM